MTDKKRMPETFFDLRFLSSGIRKGPIAQMRLERTPDKREVGSSTLPRPTTKLSGV